MAGHLGRAFRPLTRTYPLHGIRAPFSTIPSGQRKSPHAEWYSQVLPSMLPVALLGSTVYIALHLVQTHLASERYLEEAKARVEALENELEVVRRQSRSDPIVRETRAGVDCI